MLCDVHDTAKELSLWVCRGGAEGLERRGGKGAERVGGLERRGGREAGGGGQEGGEGGGARRG